MKRYIRQTFLPLLLLLVLLAGCAQKAPPISLEEVPEYTGDPWVELDGNVPSFTEEELETIPPEAYSPLDWLGRCGTAVARVGWDTMPTEERGEIGQVKPSGWHTVRYDGLVDGNYLYNRCHLIGYQLTGENANEENLITGTRYLNIEGMLPFENLVADYVDETGNHVLYRVTPVFQDSELVARGVVMEGLSVEDGGEGVSFRVYAYNVQPGVTIDYATGESWLSGEEPEEEQTLTVTYVLNTNSMRFHRPDCPSVEEMKPQNREETGESRQELLDRGYTPCGQCDP